jgi:hypothetical protein
MSNKDPIIDNDGKLDLEEIVGLPLQSKKFLAYLISEVGWKAIIFYILYKVDNKIDPSTTTLLITIVITSGFIQIGYILGQVALDKYIQITDKKTDK